jgi:hypothetical protein
MDALAARAVLTPALAPDDGVATSISKSEIEDVLDQDETPIELVLDVTQFSDGEPTETGSVAVAWKRSELMELLRVTDGEQVLLTFDRETLRQAIDAQVEAHGLRETVLALAVAATAASGATANASAEPGPFLGSGTPIVETGTAPDDRAFPRAAPAAAPELGPDDRAVPRGAPVPAPELAPDDRAVPRSAPAPAPTSVPVLSPDDRAFPRSTPIEAPVAGDASDPGISWAPSPAETAVIAGAIALVITGAFFVVGGRRRPRPGPA